MIHDNNESSFPSLNVNTLSLVSGSPTGLSKRKKPSIRRSFQYKCKKIPFLQQSTTKGQIFRSADKGETSIFQVKTEENTLKIPILRKSKICPVLQKENPDERKKKIFLPWKRKKRSLNVCVASEKKLSEKCKTNCRVISAMQLSKNSSPTKCEIDNIRINRPPKKVFYSEKQSGNISGIPAVPPCSPEYGDESSDIIIASMSDQKSRNEVKKKLLKLERRQLKKEKDELNKHLENEKLLRESIVLQKKHEQRLKIYALNKIMSKMESEQFIEFKMQQEGAPV